MDAAHVFRQGLGTIAPRQNHHPQTQPPRRPHPAGQDDLSDTEQNGSRVAHTLTACCRCRQRKTRCDPTLPRCLPCERSGSVCEYLDPAKGSRVNRYYVVKLQDLVRKLEADLEQYTEEDDDFPRTHEDIVRPGGMIRLHASDDSPRYLGPSSGISVSRLLMEQAKKYTDSNSISELIPELRARRQARMQSIQMTGSGVNRRKSYPVVSDGPAESLPARALTDKLVEIFNQKAQNFWPCLHEKVFQRDLDAVFANDPDPYKNFVVRMVIAISLQKLEIQYAGLADSYFLAAIQYFQAVIQPKDLRTLQCLVLLSQYSLLTPTRMPVYYVTGLAVKICQQEGYTDETTIGGGFNVDPLTLDMRRRLVWAVHATELGLSHVLGRPNFFGRGTDRMEVNYFATVEDEHITKDGINTTAPVSERKVTAIHFYKMRLLQAELRKYLYEVKRKEPRTDSHPWFEQHEARLREWLDTCPATASSTKEWFRTRYHQMKVMMYRPSPQIPKPSPKAANICFESSAAIINRAYQQAQSGRTDITWVFLLTLNMSLNTILWSTSYPEVRQCHTRAEVEELADHCLDALERCSERWPTTSATVQLYAILSKACLQSYDSNDGGPLSAGSTMSPPEITETQPTPPAQFTQQTQQPVPYLNPPQFGYVFDSPPEAMNAYTFDPNYPPPQPTFRSNSIFRNPATSEQHPRRFSYFPPELLLPGDPGVDADAANEAALRQTFSSSPSLGQQMPTPPESMKAGISSATPSRTTLSPEMQKPLIQMPALGNATAPPSSSAALTLTPPQAPLPNRMPPQPSALVDMIAPQPLPHTHPPQPAIQQRPLPAVTTSMVDWFAPQPTFNPSYNYGPAINNPDNLFGDIMNPAGPLGDLTAAGLGLQSLGDLGMNGVYQVPPYRQGSLTQSQQIELMNVLETEGMGDIDAYLSAGNESSGAKFFG